jgi:hypothetical protein
MGLLDSIVDTVLPYVLHVVGATIIQLGILLGPVVAIGFLMNLVARTIQNRACRSFGTRRYLIFFGGLGTIVHEGSHALACLVFGHRVDDIKWFDIDEADGTLGAVLHSYDRNSLYQLIGNFFIGIAPLIGGTLFVYYAARYLIGTDVFAAMPTLDITGKTFGSWESASALLSSVWTGAQGVFGSLLTWKHVLDWRFLVFLFLSFSVGSSIALSPADLTGAADGLGALIGVLLIFNFFTAWMDGFLTELMQSAAHTYSIFVVVMIFALLLDALVAVMVFSLPLSVQIGKSAQAAFASRRSNSRLR